MTRNFRQTCLPLICFLAVALLCNNALACPTCKDGMHDQTATAFAMSILFMMSMPFLILCGWIFAIFRMRQNMNESSELLLEHGLEENGR